MVVVAFATRTAHPFPVHWTGDDMNFRSKYTQKFVFCQGCADACSRPSHEDIFPCGLFLLFFLFWGTPIRGFWLKPGKNPPDHALKRHSLRRVSFFIFFFPRSRKGRSPIKKTKSPSLLNQSDGLQ